MAARNMILLGVGAMFVAATAIADEKPKAGTDGTVTGYDENKKVLAVEACDKKDDEWDYGPCLKVLRQRMVTILCKKGPGSYKWSFQVGSEKSTLSQSTSCSGSK